ELPRRLACEADNTRLAGNISRVVFQRQRVAVDTRHVDDHAAAFVGHDAPGKLRAEKRPGQVDLDDAPPVVFVQLDQRGGPLYARRVDQDVQVCEAIPQRLDARRHLELVGNVSGPGHRLTARVD